ncbi:MAG TPA: SigE family RNA polymerase sigma factor [Acidimicrobiales bacterium]|nr:SigE family RNA polymerase sigma factor [Acidimicrobiales bacterium]
MAVGEGSFEERFDDLYRLAYRVAFRVVGSREEAEDIAQEALVKTCMSWRKVAGYPEAFAAKVAGGKAIDSWRRVQRRPRPDAPGPTPDPAAELGVRLELQDALAHLPRRQREVVVLRYLADLSEADVAAALGCSAGTVKQHASRGLDALRHRLGPNRLLESV